MASTMGGGVHPVILLCNRVALALCLEYGRSRMAAVSGTRGAGSRPASAGSARDPYRPVILVLAVAAALGTTGGLVVGLVLSSPLLVDAGVILGISSGVLLGVLLAQKERAAGPGSPKPGAGLARGFWRRKRKSAK